jgi:hypothetical protein
MSAILERRESENALTPRSTSPSSETWGRMLGTHRCEQKRHKVPDIVTFTVPSTVRLTAGVCVERESSAARRPGEPLNSERRHARRVR